MKKGVFVVLLIVLLSFDVFASQTAETEEIIDEYAEFYGSKIQAGIESAEESGLYEVVPYFDAEQILAKAAKGEQLFSLKDMILRLLELLLIEIKKTLKVLAIIPVIAVLNTYLMGMQSDFKSKGAVIAAFFTCYVIMAGIATAAFLETVQCGKYAMQSVSIFMRTLIPVLLAGMAASGTIISATSLEILLITVIEISGIVVEKLFIPMVMIATALNIVNNLSTTINAEKLAQFINKFVKWGIGLSATIFVGITGLQGLTAGGADGLAVKITKFAASNAIPMVGGILAETVETVMNCSVVIKNAIGIVGIIVVIMMVVLPVIKMAACLILFRLCTAVIQPISDERCVKCLSGMGDSVSTVMAMTASVVVMFVIILTIIINLSNTAVLLGR